jgi:hypothetical protein
MHQGSDHKVNLQMQKKAPWIGESGGMLPQRIWKSGVSDWLKMDLPYNICYIIIKSKYFLIKYARQ